MEQLQGSLCSSLQGDPNIIKDLKNRRLWSKHARCTSQCGTFQWDESGPHPCSGESRNGYTSRQNIGRAVTAKLATEQAKSARMKKSGHCSTTAKHGHRASRNSNTSDPTSSQDRNMYSKSGKKFDPTGYCSPHSYSMEETHVLADLACVAVVVFAFLTT